MEILHVDFEQSFFIQKDTEVVKIILFTTLNEKIIKFGIEASKNIKIHREEIYESIQNQKKSADSTKRSGQ